MKTSKMTTKVTGVIIWRHYRQKSRRRVTTKAIITERRVMREVVQRNVTVVTTTPTKTSTIGVVPIRTMLKNVVADRTSKSKTRTSKNDSRLSGHSVRLIVLKL